MNFLRRIFGSKTVTSDDDPMPTRPINLAYAPTPENAKSLAQQFTNAVFTNGGIVLDYSPGSLEFVDMFLQRFKDEGLTPNDFAETVFVAGAYVGEVMVRHNNGAWIKPDQMHVSAGVFTMPMVVKLPNGKIANPIAKAFKRFRYGESDSVRYFYSVFTN